MSQVLDKILSYKREEVDAAKKMLPEASVRAGAEAAPPVRPFIGSLESRIADGGLGLIAEIKKASPSKGLLREAFDPPELARAYAAGGAACLSVLTDTPSFQGHPDYLMSARDACSLPVLRKDFMVDPYQVLEARALGADCILIILAAVDDAMAQDEVPEGRLKMLDAHAVGTAFLELGLQGARLAFCLAGYDEDELTRALRLPTKLIGINNRDLKTFDTTLATTERLAPRVPGDRMVVAESGIFTHADLTRLAACSVRSFLVGESLMRRDDVAAATRTLLNGTPVSAEAAQ